MTNETKPEPTLLGINASEVTEVLLPDGWHDVQLVPDITADGLVHLTTAYKHDQEARRVYESEGMAFPLSSVLALKFHRYHD